jgi:GNAT superfamily N-acetyltransferase
MGASLGTPPLPWYPFAMAPGRLKKATTPKKTSAKAPARPPETSDGPEPNASAVHRATKTKATKDSPAKPPEPNHAQLTFREVTSATWNDFEALFEGRGGPKYCYCMVWRATSDESKNMDRSSRKAAMKERVDNGVPVGLLGYSEGVPKAWCSIAPRATYRGGLSAVREGDESESVWSLVCFFVRRDVRRQGAMKALLEAAMQHAAAHGGTILEAYPVDEDSPSYRFGGFLPVFQTDGFVRVGKAGTRRHVVRHSLRHSLRHSTKSPVEAPVPGSS